jgi:hypothetical protein
MAVSVTLDPVAPRATIDVVRVTVDDADQNTTTGYDVDVYPTSPEVRYYLTFEEGSVEYGRSYVFGVSESGGHEFNSYVFPHDGTWTVHLRNVADDSSVVDSGNVTVS